MSLPDLYWCLLRRFPAYLLGTFLAQFAIWWVSGTEIEVALDRVWWWTGGQLFIILQVGLLAYNRKGRDGIR